MPIAIDCHGLTDTGRVRGTNEDQFLIAHLDKSVLVHQTSLPTTDHTRLAGGPRGHLFLVADGMGGAAGGHVASRLAVETLTKYVLRTLPWFFRLRSDEEEDLRGELKEAVEACEVAVAAAAAQDPARGRMGTTLTLAYVLWPRLFVVHVGDSRAYLLRDGHLHRITKDHTVAQKLVETGQMSSTAAEESRWSHVLYNCLGGGREGVDPEAHKATLRPGDALLLCTDGVTGELPDDRIAALLAAGTAAEGAAALVAAANDAGGRDNATAVVARFVELAADGQGRSP